MSETSVGTKLYISASLPATYDQAGFEALSWTVIANVSDYGTIGGSYATITTPLVDQEFNDYDKGIKEFGSMPLNHTDIVDSGRTLLDAAYAAVTDYSFKLQFKSGKILYFRGKVMSNQVNVGNGSAAITWVRNVQQTMELVKVEASTYYTLTFAAGANGSIIGGTTQTIASGGDATAVYASADDGFTFSTWAGDPITTANATLNPLTLTGITASATITASFS